MERGDLIVTWESYVSIVFVEKSLQTADGMHHGPLSVREDGNQGARIFALSTRKIAELTVWENIFIAG